MAQLGKEDRNLLLEDKAHKEEYFKFKHICIIHPSLKEIRQTLCLEKLIFVSLNPGFKPWPLWPSSHHWIGCCEVGAKPLEFKNVNLQP